MEDIVAKTPHFNGGRLILDPDSDHSHLELEIIRNSAGMRFYLNLLFLEALPCQEDPKRTCISIQFEDQEPWNAYPYLLAGGQRLLLPGDVADTLIQALLNGQSFMIQMGRTQIHVIPTQFVKTYERLLKIPL
jgi:hypothetical protein